MFFSIIIVGFKNIETSSETENGLYEFVRKFHGNNCTGAIIGVRLGLAARTSLKLKVGEKARAKFFNHSCAVDGIQIAAGTTYGNRDLEVEDHHENRLLLTSAKDGRQVEARLTRVAEEKAKHSLKTKEQIQALPKYSPERQRLEKEITSIMDWFRTSPENAVVEIKVIR
jgi:formylmethanofuran dehydrogenase subunit E